MSQCNRCLLNAMKRDARASGLTVTTLADAEWGMGGRNVYVHPSNVKIAVLAGGEDGERKQYWKAWMMSIPNKCEC